jgi:hypothetical protein
MPIAQTPSRTCPPGAGLCAGCANLKLVGSPGRTTFVLCERARTDARFVRYPRLPVLECPGFEAQARLEE